MKIARLIIYDSEPNRMANQLGLSMPDGVKKVDNGLTITVVTLGTLPLDFLALYNIPAPPEVPNDRS